MRKTLAELAMLGAGQGAATLAVLLGTRLLTELLSPSAYGEMTLWLGVVALVTGTAALPYLQAALKHYADADRRGQAPVLKREVGRWTTRLALLTAAAVAAGAMAYGLASSALGWVAAMGLAAAVGGVVMADILRSTQLTLLNAAGRNHAYSLWSVIDAWARPTLALAAVYWFSPDATSALLGIAFASLLVAAAMRWRKRRDEETVVSTSNPSPVWHTQLLRFSRPLMPLALLGWISGMSDRYLLASMASLTEAGLYAAMYGLASRPFIMISMVMELFFRQRLYAAFARADRETLRRTLAAWLGVVGAGALALFAVIWAGHELIARWLLGEAFRVRSDLMIWIASGYVLLVVSQIMERLCYAAGRTDWVLKNQIFSATASLIVAAPAIYFWGIDGAACAVPIYFGLQLIITTYFARQIWCRSVPVSPAPIGGRI